MIIYNPSDEAMIAGRMEEAQKILNSIPLKYCFISGSFLFKEKYGDIDLFVISRAKKEIKPVNKKINVIRIDFNDLYSLFYHSVSKSCIAKNILPKKPLKATIADYWNVVNEAVPTILNEKNKYHKNIRFLVLYTEYFKNNQILDGYELMKKIEKFRNFREILNYISEEAPLIIDKYLTKGYIKRYFYTQAGYYKDSLDYESQKYLYELSHNVVKGAA
ncbi:hypothetical protein HYU07_04455 [Candidatus Woesearchaeota archaeon]|nr:hypothetical protein [Candidatus Woesearchaeota archaeon]